MTLYEVLLILNKDRGLILDKDGEQIQFKSPKSLLTMANIETLGYKVKGFYPNKDCIIVIEVTQNGK